MKNKKERINKERTPSWIEIPYMIDYIPIMDSLISKHCISSDEFISAAKSENVPIAHIEFTLEEIGLRVGKLVYFRTHDIKPDFDSHLMISYLYSKVLKDLLRWHRGEIDHSKWTNIEKFIRQSINGDEKDYWTTKLHWYSLDLRYDMNFKSFKRIEQTISLDEMLEDGYDFETYGLEI